MPSHPSHATFSLQERHISSLRDVRPWNMLPREEVIALSLGELKQHLDNALTCVVWFLGGSVWSPELDLMIAMGSSNSGYSVIYFTWYKKEACLAVLFPCISRWCWQTDWMLTAAWTDSQPCLYSCNITQHRQMMSSGLDKSQPDQLPERRSLQPWAHLAAAGICKSSADIVHWKKSYLAWGQRLWVGIRNQSFL